MGRLCHAQVGAPCAQRVARAACDGDEDANGDQRSNHGLAVPRKEELVQEMEGPRWGLQHQLRACSDPRSQTEACSDEGVFPCVDECARREVQVASNSTQRSSIAADRRNVILAESNENEREAKASVSAVPWQVEVFSIHFHLQGMVAKEHFISLEVASLRESGGQEEVCLQVQDVDGIQSWSLDLCDPPQ